MLKNHVGHYFFHEMKKKSLKTSGQENTSLIMLKIIII